MASCAVILELNLAGLRLGQANLPAMVPATGQYHQQTETGHRKDTIFPHGRSSLLRMFTIYFS